MIGLFDSGLGGLTVLKAFRTLLPEYDYLYFGDNARCPYGDLDDATIRQYTEEGVQFLFDQGATIVILACNTATAHAIQYLQQTRFPDRKILGVTIPGAEKVIESGYRKIGVLATESSVKSKAYKERVHFHDDTVTVQEIAAPGLVPLIEQGRFDDPETLEYIQTYLTLFDPDIEALVLGCTHYPIVHHHIQRIFPYLPIIDPGQESALKFRDYLDRHPEIRKNLSRGGQGELQSKRGCPGAVMRFFTSGDLEMFREIGGGIVGKEIYNGDVSISILSI